MGDEIGRVKHREPSLHLSAAPVLEQCNVCPVLENVRSLSSTSSGSRTLLYTVDNAALAAQINLALKFQDCVWHAAGSPYGNHILQKIIVRLTPERLHFIVTEMEGRAVLAAQHRERSRVLQRLIEHCCTAQVKDLVDEIVCQAASLCKHLYANFILQSILEHGTNEQCASIAQAIIANALQLSKHKMSSNVVRAALVHSPHKEKLALIHVLTADGKSGM